MVPWTDHSLPKLRPVDVTPFAQNGRTVFWLRDPLWLSDRCVTLPQELVPVLGMLDGTRDLGEIRASLIVRYGVAYSLDLVRSVVTTLDDNYLLENRRAAQAYQRELGAYRAAPHRPPNLAGHSYPAEPDQLRRSFDGYLAQLDSHGACPVPVRGVVSPHIDYHRGGHVYAAVWQQAEEMARAADLVILLGTDHYSLGDRLTLTRQHYATPYGVLPTSQEIVAALVEAVGEEEAFAGELRNRGEHSLELVATWLHHMRGGRPVEMVPILTGSFADFVAGRGDPGDDATLNALVDVLRERTSSRNTLVVASGDLSHVGPAFGGRPLDAAGRGRILLADQELMAELEAGSADGFFAAIRRAQDRNNVCGVSPFYLMLRLLGDVEGQIVAYDQCPADQVDTSLVSVCGMVFGHGGAPR